MYCIHVDGCVDVWDGRIHVWDVGMNTCLGFLEGATLLKLCDESVCIQLEPCECGGNAERGCLSSQTV